MRFHRGHDHHNTPDDHLGFRRRRRHDIGIPFQGPPRRWDLASHNPRLLIQTASARYPRTLILRFDRYMASAQVNAVTCDGVTATRSAYVNVAYWQAATDRPDR